MARVIFKCPTMNQSVQHWLEDDLREVPDDEYQTVICPACSRLHFVNRKSGKLLGQRQLS